MSTTIARATVNSTVWALPFLFTVTLKRRDPREHRRQRAIRASLRMCLVLWRLPCSGGGTWHQVPGGARRSLWLGLCVSEVAHLKLIDIDSKPVLIRVEQGSEILVFYATPRFAAAVVALRKTTRRSPASWLAVSCAYENAVT